LSVVSHERFLDFPTDRSRVCRPRNIHQGSRGH
jgi:hypothetical protein